MKELRRKDRSMDMAEAQELLRRGEYGYLATVDADGQPYGIPLSYAYQNGSIYFHCAMSGHKLDNLAQNPRVSFCVVGMTKVLPEQFATAYESVVAFGQATEVQGAERYQALVWLLEKYCPQHITAGKQYMADKDQATRVFKITIRHLSGKTRQE
jgi:uncharacterized protein